MSEVKLAKNTLYLTIASIGQKAIAFIYFAIIARLFGVEDTGAYFLSLAIVTVVMVLDDLGLTSVLVREVARKPADAKMWLRHVLSIKLITMPLTVVVAWFIPVLLGYDASVITLVRIAIGIMLADTLSLTLYGVLRAMQNLKYESLGIFIGQSITATIGITAMLTGHIELFILIFALLAGSVWNLTFSIFHVIKRLGIGGFIPSYAMGFKPLRMALAFFLAAAFTKIYSYVDSLILAHQLGEGAVGEYAVAYKLTYAFQFLPLAFVAALYPTMSAQSHNPDALRKTLMDAFWYMAVMAFPLVFGIWALAPEIIHAFYGMDYTGSILPLQVLIFVLLFIFMDFPLGSLLNATNRQHIKTAIMGGTMVINAIANIILIPMMGVAGASVAALISFSFMFIAGWISARTFMQISFIEVLKEIWGIVIAAFIMMLAVIFVKSVLHFALAIPFGAIIFFTIAYLTGGIKDRHVQYAKRIIFRT